MSAPANAEAVLALQAAHPSLPIEYLSFLAQHNGAEGPLGIEPGWFMLWPAEEVSQLSDAYQIPEGIPGYVAFGSNGGGELFVFPIQPVGGAFPVFMVPAVGMEAATVLQVAPNFNAFVAAFGGELA